MFHTKTPASSVKRGSGPEKRQLIRDPVMQEMEEDPTYRPSMEPGSAELR